MSNLAPFAALQQMVNTGVMAHLADAVAVIDGGEPFSVQFDKPYAGPFDGQVDSASPEIFGHAQHLGALQRDDAITINGTAYRVTTAEPDGTGMVRLVLYVDGGA